MKKKNDDKIMKSHKLVSFLMEKFILRFLKRDSVLQIYQVLSSLSILFRHFWGKFTIQGYKVIRIFPSKNDIALNLLPNLGLQTINNK